MTEQNEQNEPLPNLGDELPLADDLEREAAQFDFTHSPENEPENELVRAQELEAQEQKVQAAGEYAVLLESVLGPGFALLAPNWGVQPEEIKTLSGVYGQLLAKYWPEPADFGPEIAAAVVTVAMFGPRLRVPRKVEPQKTEGNPVESVGSGGKHDD